MTAYCVHLPADKIAVALTKRFGSIVPILTEGALITENAKAACIHFNPSCDILVTSDRNPYANSICLAVFLSLFDKIKLLDVRSPEFVTFLFDRSAIRLQLEQLRDDHAQRI